MNSNPEGQKAADDWVYVNKGFDGSSEPAADLDVQLQENGNVKTSEALTNGVGSVKKESPERQNWDKPVEFLLSCIAMSVGLGNLWRFPVTAFENGGGAFLIPYIIVLFVIGKPIYFMEMTLGQFCSCGQVKVWEIAPAFRGVGWAMMVSVVCLVTYYCSLMALSAFYFFASFTSELPWSKCDPGWDRCMDSNPSAGNYSKNFTNYRSSSEIYFLDTVIHQKQNVDDGIGYPEWRLVLCLIFSWALIFLVLAKGVQSSGKAAYFMALFPYVVLVALLIKGAMLPGAVNGILYFITPRFEELLSPNVWMAAVTQCFFSLTVSFGPIIYYSSFNNFRHNFHRDVWIVTTLDTFTSLLAGFTIFSILGNLAYELGIEDVSKVVQGGTGLAFISYPDAISKFDAVPQLFSVLFFTMLFTLGLGSAVSLTGSVITILSDMMPSIKGWIFTLVVCICGCILGLIYITPGGQFMLTLVDFHGSSFIVYILSFFEVIAIIYVYGMENFCRDIEFTIGVRVSAYWRICWAVLIPVFLPAILIYSFVNFQPLTYTGISYPISATVCGWILTAIGVLQIPIWMIIVLKRSQEKTFHEKLVSIFKPSGKWGPRNQQDKEDWRKYKLSHNEEIRTKNKFVYALRILLGLPTRRNAS